MHVERHLWFETESSSVELAIYSSLTCSSYVRVELSRVVLAMLSLLLIVVFTFHSILWFQTIAKLIHRGRGKTINKWNICFLPDHDRVSVFKLVFTYITIPCFRISNRQTSWREYRVGVPMWSYQPLPTFSRLPTKPIPDILRPVSRGA